MWRGSNRLHVICHGHRNHIITGKDQNCRWRNMLFCDATSWIVHVDLMHCFAWLVWDTLFTSCRLLWSVVQGDGARWRYSVHLAAAVECGQFNTEHVQLGCSAAELHGNIRCCRCFCDALLIYCRDACRTYSPLPFSRQRLRNDDRNLAWWRILTLLTRDLRIVFCVRIESNRPSDSISNRIFESNRPYIPRKP